MKRVSLYKELFDDVDSNLIKFKKDESESKLSIDTVKYETSVCNLEKMCYMMECVILRRKFEGCIYAGFQKISRAKAVWDRFLKMADNVDKIYVYGVLDEKLESHPNIQIIPLTPMHPLTREWFLVFNTKFNKNMMVAYDQDGFGVKPIEKDRNFIGIKTVNLKVIDKAINLLENAM
ncbi:MAG: hypothetical protein N4A54_13065 [Peptostreptococcaceae bacterium]|jgi:DICT domain-containing protein|nr:hypothetical protein [Peptostreptococcaceae bacterium]